MITVQLKDGVAFDPDKVYAWFIKQQKEGGMDPKWMPDYIRVIESFSRVQYSEDHSAAV